MEHLPKHMQNLQCDYCALELPKSQWSSCWGENDDQHYKSFNCTNCSKQNWFRVRFHGSGHDSFIEKANARLEPTANKLEEKLR